MYDFFKQIVFKTGAPRYIQLAEYLEDAIRKNKFDAKFLPAERELARLLKVSRITVSNALTLLENKQLIIRQQGLGTQINTPLNYSLNQLTGFTERMEKAGFSVADRWLIKQKTIASDDIAIQLELPKQSKISYLQRIRLINNQPSSIESTYIPLQFLPEPESFTGSLYTYWSNQKIYIGKKTSYFSAVSCDSNLAPLLQQSEHTPLLRIYEISRNTQGQVVEVSDIKCLSQYYYLQLETQ